MGFLKDVFSNFLAFIFLLLGFAGIIITLVFWLFGQLLPWGLVSFIATLFFFAVARASAKRG